MQRVKVSVVTLTGSTRFGELCMALTRLLERIQLGVSLGIRHVRLDKLGRVWLHRSDGLGASVQEGLGHGRLVRCLAPSVQRVICRLEGHLHVGVRRESVPCDKVLAVAVEFEHLALVLADEIRQPRLAVPDAVCELLGEVPLELLGCRGLVNVLGLLRIGLAERAVGLLASALGVRAGLGLEETLCGRVDGLGEAHDELGIHVGRIAQHSMAIDARMLKIDAGSAVGTDDDLELVVPSVGARARLDAALQLVGSAEHVVAQLGGVGGFGVVHAHDKKRRVDDLEALAVVRVLAQVLAVHGPDGTLLRGEDAHRSFGNVVDLDLVGVAHDGLQVTQHSALGEQRTVLLVERLEPVDLAAAHDDDMPRLGLDLHPASVGGGDARGGKEACILVHVQRSAAHVVWLENACAQIVDEGQTGEDEVGGPHELVAARRGGVILEDEEGVEVEHDRVRGLEVALVPEFLDVAGARAGVLLQLLLKRGALVLEKVFDDALGRGMLLGRLEREQTREVSLTCIFELWDGKVGQLGLALERLAASEALVGAAIVFGSGLGLDGLGIEDALCVGGHETRSHLDKGECCLRAGGCCGGQLAEVTQRGEAVTRGCL
ncbi:hypothetical protein L1887_57015 [Cichorium endivia]|nr:hypothetical protein L1887_57015 [Cichorium endivia]